MGAVKNVVFDIEEAIEEGLLSFPEIATNFGMTLADVCLISEELDMKYEHQSMMYEAEYD
jgi:hypothetical protein